MKMRLVMAMMANVIDFVTRWRVVIMFFILVAPYSSKKAPKDTCQACIKPSIVHHETYYESHCLLLGEGSFKHYARFVPKAHCYGYEFTHKRMYLRPCELVA